jgi:hypothetical protein
VSGGGLDFAIIAYAAGNKEKHINVVPNINPARGVLRDNGI